MLRGHFIPETWFENENSKVLITAYRIINHGDFLPTEEQSVIDLGDIRVGLIFGTIKYHRFDEEWDFTAKDRTLRLILNQNDKEKEGAWILFFQKFYQEKEAAIKQVLSSYVALFSLVFGKAAVFSREYQHILCENNSTTFSSSIILHPSFLGDPSFSDERFDLLSKANSKISSMSAEDSARVNLSLHWFEKGMLSKGVDSFLQFWIALEALAMPDGTDISPIKQYLKEIYHPETNIRDDRFFVGRIFGLRSRIVHNGLVVPIQHQLEEYMQGLYIDILFHILKLPSDLKVKKALENPNSKLNEILSQLS